MRPRYAWTAAVATVLAAFVSGCAVYPAGRATAVPPAPVPKRFSDTGEDRVTDCWWKRFHDETLNALVERALRGNLDLKGAWSRLDQAGALAVQAGALRLPEITADGGFARTRVNRPTAPMKSTANLWTLGLAASYEVDLWGRVRSVRGAALEDLRATREDLDTAIVSLAASVGEAWFALVEQRAQKKLLAEQEKVSRTFLELTELRFSQGQASALDVYQQRQHLAAIRSQLAPIEARRNVLRHQLAVLQGRTPTAPIPEGRDALPDLPPLPDTGLPADLLHRRPDVSAAYYRVAAADHRVAAAIAERFPTLRLTGRTGYQANEMADVLDNWVWNLAAGLAMPVFDAGRRKAEVARARAELVGRLTEYGQAILVAVREVEDALVRERQQRTFLADLDHQVQLAQATLNEARARYANGLTDFLNVLTALQALHLLQRERIAAHRQLISFRIRLHRALGGSWTKGVEPSVKLSFMPSAGPASSKVQGDVK